MNITWPGHQRHSHELIFLICTWNVHRVKRDQETNSQFLRNVKTRPLPRKMLTPRTGTRDSIFSSYISTRSSALQVYMATMQNPKLQTLICKNAASSINPFPTKPTTVAAAFLPTGDFCSKANHKYITGQFKYTCSRVLDIAWFIHQAYTITHKLIKLHRTSSETST